MMFFGSKTLYKYISRLGIIALTVFIFGNFMVPSANAGQGIISGSVVNVRSGPGSDEVVGSVLKGTQVEVLDTSGSWTKIQYANLQGWVTSQYISTAASKGSSAAPRVILNQTEMQFEVTPRIEKGRTLVPLRAIFEAMGANVEWDESTRTVTARNAATTVILPLDSTVPTVNGQVRKLETAAKIVDGRTLAPLRFIGEAFGGQVDWNAENRVININFVPLAQPEAVTVKDTSVNLRQTPTILAAIVDVAVPGENMTVLASKDGWYQVQHGSITAWVAAWVVEAVPAGGAVSPSPAEPEMPVIVEPPKTTEPPETTEPEIPAVVEPTAPAPQEPENAIHLSRSQDSSGIKIIITSQLKMDPEVKEGSGSIQYEFKERPLFGLNYFEEAVGSQLLKAKASSQDQDTLIKINFPSDLEYKLSVEENGKKLVVFIPNTLLGLQSSAFGSVGDRFVITTLCPVTPEGNATDDKVEVRIPNLRLKNEDSYKYSSDLVSGIKIKPDPDRESDLLITFKTSDKSKYSFATSGSNADLNIILMKKSSSQPRAGVVVLDPGHGGRDTGARGSLINEKEVNLAVALKVGELLKQKGISVEYTRTDDSFVELEEESSIANRLNAALFVSIHCNSTTSAAPGGTETYYYAPLANPDLYVQRDERFQLATLLQNEMIRNWQLTNRGVKEGNLSVLRNTKMPSALVEMAFISNPDEQALLMSDDSRNLAAQAIANAIEQYMGN